MKYVVSPNEIQCTLSNEELLEIGIDFEDFIEYDFKCLVLKIVTKGLVYGHYLPKDKIMIKVFISEENVLAYKFKAFVKISAMFQEPEKFYNKFTDLSGEDTFDMDIEDVVGDDVPVERLDEETDEDLENFRTILQAYAEEYMNYLEILNKNNYIPKQIPKGVDKNYIQLVKDKIASGEKPTFQGVFIFDSLEKVYGALNTLPDYKEIMNLELYKMKDRYYLYYFNQLTPETLVFHAWHFLEYDLECWDIDNISYILEHAQKLMDKEGIFKFIDICNQTKEGEK